MTDNRPDSGVSLARRAFLQRASACAAATLLASPGVVRGDDLALRVATFRADVSPPLGHPLCGGWIPPVAGQDDPLEAIGLVLLGAGEPIVLCSVDWTGLLNEANWVWRERLAEAAGTTPARVAVHCVHQHNAPFVCLASQRLCAAYPDLPPAVVEPDFFTAALEGVAASLCESLPRARAVTHVATSQARVERVASNRRILGPDGKVAQWRASSSRDPAHKEAPEGLIDPQLKTVAFYDGDTRVAACHYYATHPMSYYGDGRVSSDFAGLARKQLQADDGDCTHVYFTGCAGNIAAGKYNDGTPTARRELTARMHDALVRSVDGLRPEPIRSVGWQTHDVVAVPRQDLAEDQLRQTLANSAESVVNRVGAAMRLTWLRRCREQVPLPLAALHVNDATLLHLPSEMFVEYQLRAQEMAPRRFVATAAYGDGGAWYMPTREAYPQGGYEVTVALCAPEMDEVFTRAIEQLVSVG